MLVIARYKIGKFNFASNLEFSDSKFSYFKTFLTEKFSNLRYFKIEYFLEVQQKFLIFVINFSFKINVERELK